MNRMEDAKKKYEDIPVPEALGQRVQAAVARSKKQQRNGSRACFTGRPAEA